MRILVWVVIAGGLVVGCGTSPWGARPLKVGDRVYYRHEGVALGGQPYRRVEALLPGGVVRIVSITRANRGFLQGYGPEEVRTEELPYTALRHMHGDATAPHGD